MPIAQNDDEANEFWRKKGEERSKRKMGSYQELLEKVLSQKEAQLANTVDESIKEGERTFSGTRADTPPDSPDNIAAKLVLIEQTVLDRIADRDLRIKASKTLFELTMRWIKGVFLFLLLKGFFEGFSFTTSSGTVSVKWFSLPDAVAIALIGSTAVFGLLGIILNGLFRDRHKKSSEDSG